MTFSELAQKRYSVRKFSKEPVPQEIIEKILKTGLVAPTARNWQPIRILVLNNDESLKKLQKCTECHFNAPAAMLVCYNKDECAYRAYDNFSYGPVDASIVTTHLMFQATELGIGTTWVGHFNPDSIRHEFSIPDNIVPLALLVMGYPAQDAAPSPRHTEFRPEEEIVVYDSF
ncbi:MAG: nitroreductase family protein [Acutalibacteraceae bacterium]|jgi:nitroreductase